jgi:hypothetical protein
MLDILIFHRGLWGIEIKRRGGRLSKMRIVRTRRGSPRVLVGQAETFPALIASGGFRDIAIVHAAIRPRSAMPQAANCPSISSTLVTRGCYGIVRPANSREGCIGRAHQEMYLWSAKTVGCGEGKKCTKTILTRRPR